MKFMVLIAKHHDGFAQCDSKGSDYDIMASPYGKDIIRAYAEACHQQDQLHDRRRQSAAELRSASGRHLC